MSADLERTSLSSASLDSGGRALSTNVRKLHDALNLLLSEPERQHFIHTLNHYHSKRNVFDLVQTLKVILDSEGKRQLLPMLRLVIPRSDQLLFDQYTSEGLYLRADLLASPTSHQAMVERSPPSPLQHPSNVPSESFSTISEGTAPPSPPPPGVLLRRPCPQELPAEIRQVNLKRRKSHEGLGFSIRGGSEHGVGIYVSLVEPGSLAEKEGLRVGDQILKVNDTVFDRVTHAEAVKVLKGCKKLSMSVCSVGRIPGGYVTNHIYTWVDPQGRSVSPPPDLVEHRSATVRHTSSHRRSNSQMLQEGDEKRVNLVLDNGRSLGLMIRGGAEYALGIYITGVDRGSAAQLGGLKIGDQILEVNGVSFLNIPHDEAVQMLKSSRHLMMLVKDVGRLPHARTVVDETRWITSEQIAESSARGCVTGMCSDKASLASGRSVFYKGVAGSQVTLNSLVNQLRALLDEQARILLTEPERQTLNYYLEEYQKSHIGVEPLVMALLELFNTHAKFTLISEVRGLVAPQDLERFDGMVLYHEIKSMQVRQDGPEELNTKSLSTTPCHNWASSSANCSQDQVMWFIDPMESDNRPVGNKERPMGSQDLLPDISLDEFHSTNDSPPPFKPPPPPGLKRQSSQREKASQRDKPQRPSSGSSQSGLFFTAPPSTAQNYTHSSPSAGLPKQEVSSMLNQPATKARTGTAPSSPSLPLPSPSLPTPVSPSADKPVPYSPTSNQHSIMVEIHRACAERDLRVGHANQQARGATLSQLSDSGQTLSEDSGVDIAETGGLSKDSSPRPGKSRLSQEVLGAKGIGAEASAKLPAVLELTSTLVRVKKSASTLGIAIEGGANTRQPIPRIVTIQKGGSAYNCTQLKVGQVILEVNGVSLRGREHQEAARLIAEAFKTKERDYIDFVVTEFNVAM